MINYTIILSVVLLMLGILLLAIALKKPEHEKERYRIKKNQEEIELINRIKAENPTQELRELSKITKGYIKKTYRLSDRLSLNELIKELEDKQDQRLKQICERIRGYYYTKNETTKQKNQEIKKELIETIESIEREKKKKELERREKENIVDRIKNKEQEMREQIRIQKIRHSKFKEQKKEKPKEVKFGE